MSEEREFLLRSLADLEAERAAGDLAEADYADLRARYERKLAETSGSGLRSPSLADANADQNGRGGVRWVRVVATVVVVAAVGVGAGVLVAQSSGSRAPGETITGGVPQGAAARLREAAELVAEGNAADAVAMYQEVLDEEPDNVVALTYFGWLLRNIARNQADDRLHESGVRLIERATDIDPEYAEAWLFRGIIYLRDEDSPRQAIDALRLALASDPIPEVAAAARDLLAEIAETEKS